LWRILRLGDGPPQHEPRLLHVDVLRVETHHDAIASERLRPVAQHRIGLAVAGEHERLCLRVERSVRSVRGSASALDVHVPVDREAIDRLSEQRRLVAAAAADLPLLLRLRFVVGSELDDRAIAGHHHSAARQTDRRIEASAVVARLEPHRLRSEVHRTSRDGWRGRGQDGGERNHRVLAFVAATAWPRVRDGCGSSVPETPPVNVMSLPSACAEKPCDRTA
jgi:hypothetical protein